MGLEFGKISEGSEVQFKKMIIFHFKFGYLGAFKLEKKINNTKSGFS